MIPVENRPMLDQAMANCKELLVLCSSLPEIDGEGREVGLCSLSVVALSHILILFFFTVLRSAEFVSKVLALSFFSIFFFFFTLFFCRVERSKRWLMPILQRRISRQPCSIMCMQVFTFIMLLNSSVNLKTILLELDSCCERRHSS